MSSEEPGATPPNTAPPTEVTYALPPEQPSSWPMVIGIIAIVIGGLGGLGALFSLLSPLFNAALAESMPPEQRASFEIAQQYQVWTIAFSLLKIILTVVLIVAGVGLTQRKPWGVKAAWTWALARIVVALPELVLGYFIQQKTFEFMREQGALPAGVPMEAFGAGGICLGAAFVLVLPLFLIIWLSRGKIRAEVAGWAQSAPST